MSDKPLDSQSGIQLPTWLRLTCAALALIFIGVLVINNRNSDTPLNDLTIVESTAAITFQKNIPTIWTDIVVNIESVARINNKSIIAEWSYENINSDISSSFSWGFAQENHIAKTKIIDAADKEFDVSLNVSGLPACSNTNKEADENWSKEIFGGRDLSAWAQFSVPRTATKPLAIKIHGIREPIKIPVLSISDQNSRIYQPRATNWPDISIQLISINNHDDGTLELSWDYINNNQQERFIWGLNQPNYVAQTQIYDYKTGKYHNVQRVFQEGDVRYVSTSTNKDDNSGWSKTIPPGGKIRANARFKKVLGKNIQILFHSAMPLFYNPRTNSENSDKLTN